MEEWVPLFDIFLKSPSPETEASRWLDEASSSSSSSSSSPINRSSFLTLLKKQCDVTDQSSSPTTKKVLFIETLPDMVQSRILSFLLLEYPRFRVREVLDCANKVDFWVQRAAHNLLDTIPQRKFDVVEEEFDSLPDWLSNKAGTFLPWLPLSCVDLESEAVAIESWNGKKMMSQKRDYMEEDHHDVVDSSIDDSINVVALDPDDHETVAKIRARISSFECSSEALRLCDEIRRLCLDKGKDSFRVLALIEPWHVDDETAAVFLSNMDSTSDDEQELGWPSQVLCSIVLPKFLALEKSASRVLMSATIEYCKVHQRAAEYALVFPLILRKNGINNFICEAISRVLKECWHLGHISAFCQKLLCGRREEKLFLFLPCHQSLISDDPTWNESMFILFQNILTHNVPLTQASVDCLVSKVQELADRYSNSLKFGNFLLHLIAKCAPMLQAHKYLLIESVKCTNSLVTKSLLSKLNAL